MKWGHSLKADLALRTRWELFRSSSWLLNVIASLNVYKPDVLEMGSSLVYIQQMSIDGINIPERNQSVLIPNIDN